MARRYRFDDIEVDLDGFRVLKSGKPLAVQPKVLNLLIYLVENRGRLVSRRELIDAVWNGAFVTDHVLNRAMYGKPQAAAARVFARARCTS